jgi:sterol desaturase/sphingolipid hydroxylase (fatty acid hydroxylase superfamily)
MDQTIADIKIDYSDEPIRLFKSDFLEFFTHVTPTVVVVIWVPVVLFFLYSAITGVPSGGSLLFIPIAFLLGILVWTITEYLMHRYVFHFHPTKPWEQKIFFMFHGVHHAQPNCKTRLVMPPAASIPMAVIFIVLFYGIGALFGIPQWSAPLIAGFTLGYIVYDLMHYATHHAPMKGRALKFLKKYHMLHHFKTPEQRYGVSSPLWDKVFGTYIE